MASLTPDEALRRLRRLYRDAHHVRNAPVDDCQVLAWAQEPNLTSWATHMVRSRGWTYQVVEATLRQARQLLRRAVMAQALVHVLPESTISDGQDPFDSLIPSDEQS
jgi:hypothetical protein